MAMSRTRERDVCTVYEKSREGIIMSDCCGHGQKILRHPKNCVAGHFGRHKEEKDFLGAPGLLEVLFSRLVQAHVRRRHK